MHALISGLSISFQMDLYTPYVSRPVVVLSFSSCFDLSPTPGKSWRKTTGSWPR